MRFEEKIKPLDELFTYFYLFSPITYGVVASLGMDLKLLWLPLITFMLWTLYIYAYRAKYQLQDEVELSMIERARGLMYFFGLVITFSSNSVAYLTTFLLEYKLLTGLFMILLLFLLEWFIPRTFFQKQTQLFNKTQKRLFGEVLFFAGNVALYYSIIVMTFNSLILLLNSWDIIAVVLPLNLIVVLVFALFLYRQERKSRRLAKNLAALLKGTKWLKKYLDKKRRK